MRYVIYCLMFAWLMLSIVYSRCNYFVSLAFLLWVTEFGLSSYLVEKSYEYDTTPLLAQTVEFVNANMEPDALIIYDFTPNFYMAYDYYIPGHEYISSLFRG
jgi:hypothetical protein